MKRILLIFACILLYGLTYSQSLSLSYSGGDIEPGSTLEVIGDPADNPIQIEIQVTNNSGSDLNVKVKKVIMPNDTLPGTDNTFCWGLCFPSFVYVSPDPITIAAGATIDEFDGDYIPNGIPGKSKISYVFFVDENPDDSVKVSVIYNASPLGIGEEFLANSNVSAAYPNPANQNVKIDYSVPADLTGIKVSVSNILGAVVKEVTLNDNFGKLVIPVDDLENGIYFYTFSANNHILATKKFVVRH